MTNEQITDVEPKTATEAAPALAPALRSVYQENKFYIGVCNPETVQDDGTFSLSNALVYTNMDTVLNDILPIVEHARAVRDELIAKNAYNAGVEAGTKGKEATE